MENLTVRELIRFLLSFNMDAKVYISVKDKEIPMQLSHIYWTNLGYGKRKTADTIVFHPNFKLFIK